MTDPGKARAFPPMTADEDAARLRLGAAFDAQTWPAREDIATLKAYWCRATDYAKGHAPEFVADCVETARDRLRDLMFLEVSMDLDAKLKARAA
jgi:hypothetical protein